MKRILFGVLLSLFLAGGAAAQTRNIFLTQQEIASLPTSGGGWTGMKSAADQAPGTPKISDQDSPENVRTLARALVYLRTGTESYKTKVIDALRAAPGTESGGRTLALGRQLGAYVLAADLIGYRDPAWVSYVSSVRTKTLDGATLISKSETKCNNWGSVTNWSRVIADIYINDTTDLAKAVKVFKGTLGDRTAFVYPLSAFGDDLSWQPDPSKPVVICGLTTTIQGHIMSGALPEELRRAGSFRWPPFCENYVFTAYEGYLGTAWVLWHSGVVPDIWNLQDRALLRVTQWNVQQANCNATGNDTWQPSLVNAVYGTTYNAPSPSQHGKLLGYTDWFARVFNGTTPPPTPVPDTQATFEFHNDPATQRWSCHRILSGPDTDTLGTGTTKDDALKDWLAHNPGEI